VSSNEKRQKEGTEEGGGISALPDQGGGRELESFSRGKRELRDPQGGNTSSILEKEGAPRTEGGAPHGRSVILGGKGEKASKEGLYHVQKKKIGKYCSGWGGRRNVNLFKSQASIGKRKRRFRMLIGSFDMEDELSRKPRGGRKFICVGRSEGRKELLGEGVSRPAVRKGRTLRPRDKTSMSDPVFVNGERELMWGRVNRLTS